MINVRINQILSLLFLSSLLSITSQLGHTEDTLSEINFELSGTVRAWACGVMDSESQKVIDLGKHSTKNLSSLGDRSLTVAIPFSLNSCPPNGTVNITITGAKDPNNNELLALDNIIVNGKNPAKNIAIEISDQNKKRIPIGTKTTGLKSDLNGKLSTTLYANYIVTKSQVEVGIANSKMQFSIEYE
ncbi:fimbrial protein [Acinetobacter nematophilus]|uniref:Fimbrial protein n=1 Tax=Acinetobacter nematophilus TaxID=2994642 RepID=A0A9X3IJ88_9GAMM|nr:fimbrial protein [Acinetobacter nematophilus]MCX5469029.1 fimbrial protein [Acinetobacter nematophilus]